MSKLIDTQSLPSTKNELDLFRVPPTQIAVEDCYWKEVQLTNGVSNEGPYEFHIAPTPQMMQLSKNYLLIELKIVNADDGSDLAAVATVHPMVGPINLIGSTFIKQMKVFINGGEVFDSGDKYAYRAYMETELNYGSDAKNSQLQAGLYFPDTWDHIDDVNNVGLTNRSTPFRTSSIVQVMAPLHCDLFAQNRYMLNQVDLRLQLYRNSDKFCLMKFGGGAAGNYKFVVHNMRWFIKMINVQPSITLSIEKMLLQNTAKYPVRRVEVKTMHIAAGRQDCPQTPIFNGQIPRRLVLGMVDYDAYIGSVRKSPFNFKPFSISELSVTAGGKTTPFKPLTMNFDENQIVRAYVHLFEGLGIADENKGNEVNLKRFSSGSTLFAFDLSSDEDDGEHWDLAKDGAVYINMRFAQNVPNGGIEVIAYAEFDNLITVDRNRNAYTDYKV